MRKLHFSRFFIRIGYFLHTFLAYVVIMFSIVGKYFLFILAVLEVLMLTYLQNIFKPYFSPVVFLLCSVFIAFLYLWVAINERKDRGNSGASKIFSIISIAVFAALSCVIFFTLKKIFAAVTPEDFAAESDVIPQVMELTQRFLNGKMPYTPIVFPGYTLYPTYLPLQWLPYILAEINKIDYRWIAAIFLWLSCVYHFVSSKLYAGGRVWGIVASLWPMLLWYVMIKNDSNLFGITVESLVASYYLFIANAIKRNNIGLITAGLCLTLLSRYSIILWVPCALAAICMNKGRWPAAKIVIAIFVAFIVVYWLPFLRYDSHIFFKGYAYHSRAALGEWTPQYGEAWPMHLYNGLGMVTWAYRLLPLTDLQQRLHCYQIIHLSLCLLLVSGLTWWYWKYRHMVELKTFLLFSLKFYLVVFYNFIQIPYKYLFITPVLITAVLIADVFTTGQPKIFVITGNEETRR